MAESRLQLVIDAQDNASKALKGLSGNLQKMKPQFQKMAIWGTAAFLAIGTGVFKATQMAVDAQETFNKFSVVFQDVGDEAEAAAKDLRDNWGLASSSAKELLGNTGDLLTGLGMTGEAALELSTKTQKLAIDLASFTNIQGGAKRASEAITKAMLGEREMMKLLGVVIREEDIKLALANKGQQNLTGSALLAAKAQATLDIAMSQSKNAMGDFARTSDQVANQQRILGERFKEMSEEIGVLFIPILSDLVNKMLPVIKGITDWARENPAFARGVIIATLAIAGLVAVVGLLGLAIGAMSPVATLVIAVIASIGIGIAVLAKVWKGISKAFTRDLGMFRDGWKETKVSLTETASGIGEAIEGLTETFLETWDTVKQATSEAWSEILNILDFALAFIKGLIILTLNAIFPEWRAWLSEMILSLQIWGEEFIAFWTLAWDSIKQIVTEHWMTISTFLTEVWTRLTARFQGQITKLTTILNVFKSVFAPIWTALWNSVSGIFIGIWEGIKAGFKSFVNWIIEKINSLIGAINKLIEGINKVATVGGRLGGGIPTIPSIPFLAKGGIVKRPTLAMVGESGPEAVIPLNRAGAGAGVGGVTVNLSIGTLVGAGMDMEDLSLMIGDTIMDKLKTNMRV